MTFDEMHERVSRSRSCEDALTVLDDWARSNFSAERVECVQSLAKRKVVEEARLAWNEAVAREVAEQLGIPYAPLS